MAPVLCVQDGDLVHCSLTPRVVGSGCQAYMYLIACAIDIEINESLHACSRAITRIYDICDTRKRATNITVEPMAWTGANIISRNRVRLQVPTCNMLTL